MVVRQLLRVDNRPARPGDEPKCLDPMPVTPEPLEFLLPDAPRRLQVHPRRDRRSSMGARPLMLDYKPRSSGKPTATVDPKGTDDKECVLLDLPRRFRGRIWVDPDTHAMLRIDETLVGPTDVPVPAQGSRTGVQPLHYADRSDSTMRYTAVRLLTTPTRR